MSKVLIIFFHSNRRTDHNCPYSVNFLILVLMESRESWRVTDFHDLNKQVLAYENISTHILGCDPRSSD